MKADEDITDEDLNNLVCPECRANKHGNCDGTTWDTVIDKRVTCICFYLGHVTKKEDNRGT